MYCNVRTKTLLWHILQLTLFAFLLNFWKEIGVAVGAPDFVEDFMVVHMQKLKNPIYLYKRQQDNRTYIH